MPCRYLEDGTITSYNASAEVSLCDGKNIFKTYGTITLKSYFAFELLIQLHFEDHKLNHQDRNMKIQPRAHNRLVTVHST